MMETVSSHVHLIAQHSLGIYSCLCHLPHIKLEQGTCLSDLHFIIRKNGEFFDRNKLLDDVPETDQ